MTISNQPSAPRVSRRVLLVEDDAGLAYALEKQFAGTRIEVERVPTAFEALERLAHEDYEAVLLDLITPGPMNGFAVITYLETELPKMIDRLFILSGMPEQTIMHAAPGLLPRYYRKPFDVAEVVSAVSRHISDPSVPSTEPSEILVVDDDEMQRRLISQVAWRLERATRHSGDGHDAIRQLATTDFSAVVIDLMLPYVDGYGVLRYLREAKPALLQRTVVVTGMPERFRSAPLLENVCTVIEKPIDLARLQSAIAGCLDG